MLKISAVTLLASLSLSAPALSLADPVDAEAGTDTSTSNIPGLPFALYRTPVVPAPTALDHGRHCLALEREIARLLPQTYSYKPDFYSDPYQGTAVWVGTTLFPPAYALSAFIGYVEYRERGRIISAEERIEVLRHLKAQQHCFES